MHYIPLPSLGLPMQLNKTATDQTFGNIQRKKKTNKKPKKEETRTKYDTSFT